MIGYTTITPSTIQVRIDGKVSGHIRHTEDGWAYQPKGSKAIGERNPSLNAVKRSLED